MSRAERRQAERATRGDWTPFDPKDHATLAERLVQHTNSCPRCSTGLIEKFGCKWLSKFYDSHAAELNKMLSVVQQYDETTTTDV